MPSSPPIPPVLGDRFDLGPELGRGAMGVVYRVFDRALGMEVAAKVLERPDPDLLFYLKREFRELAALTHPHLVQFHELVQTDDRWLLTMECVEGVSLDRAALDSKQIPRLAEQAGDALRYLHARGKLHRDIKPANLLVAEGPRVAIADFGLMLPAHAVPGSPALVGSLSYAAPELLAGRAPSRASDWYALGQSLIEACLGTPLFDGPLPQVTLEKRQGLPEATAGRVTTALGAAADPLLRLMSPAPGARMLGAAAILRDPSIGDESSPFVGRVAELDELDALLESVWSGCSRLVHVVGESGIGKSALVEHWLARICRGPRAPVIVRGRCQPRESVRHRALDPLIDSISESLASESEAIPIVDEDTGPLLQLFPVLGRVPRLAERRWPSQDLPREEIAERAVRSLVRLLRAWSRRRPLVLWIDDEQWSDEDSASILSAVAGDPETRLLFVVSRRSEIPPGAVSVRLEREERLDARELAIEPLGEDMSRALARELGLPEHCLPVRKGRGFPFFILEAKRWVAHGGDERLPEDLVRARLERLPEADRRLLELVALSNVAVPIEIVLEAAELDRGSAARIFPLFADGLLRPDGEPGMTRLCVDHDRIRDSARRMTSARAASHHAMLAAAWERRPDPDPEILVDHYLGAGDKTRAFENAVRAGDRASKSLSFYRAGELYELANALREALPDDGDLLTRAAECWEQSGHGKRAGEAYQRAAKAVGEVDHDTGRVLELRSRAGGQYLLSGRLDLGLDVMQDVLAALGVRFSRRPERLLIESLWHRFRLIATALPEDMVLRDEEDPAERLIADAMTRIARGTAMQQHLLSDVIGVRLLRRTLKRRGQDLPRMLAMEAAVESSFGGSFLLRRSERLLALAYRLANDSGEPKPRADVRINRAAVAWFRGDWRRCRAEALSALELYEQECPGSAWEADICSTFLFGALGELGEIAELTRRSDAFLERARARGDDRALHLHHSAQLALVPLARDEPEAAIEAANRARTLFATDRFTSQSFTQLMEIVRIHLYRDDAEAAHDTIETAWPGVRRTGFLRSEGMGIQIRYLRAKAALAAARCAAPERRNRPIRIADTEASAISSASLPHAEAFGQAIRAGTAAVAGGDGSGLAQGAIQGFVTANMTMHAAALRVFLAESRGGAETMSEQGVKRPCAFARALVPDPRPDRRLRHRS